MANWGKGKFYYETDGLRLDTCKKWQRADIEFYMTTEKISKDIESSDRESSPEGTPPEGTPPEGTPPANNGNGEIKELNILLIAGAALAIYFFLVK